MKTPTLWKLEDYIKTKTDLVGFLVAAIEDTNEKPTKKDMEWLVVACTDFIRIAKERGWVE